MEQFIILYLFYESLLKESATINSYPRKLKKTLKEYHCNSLLVGMQIGKIIME